LANTAISLCIYQSACDASFTSTSISVKEWVAYAAASGYCCQGVAICS
jgi:hypothetical protein